MSQELKPIEALKEHTPTLSRLMQLNTGTDVDTEAMVKQEIEFLRLMTLTKPEIAQCNANTVVLAMKSIIRKNLTLDPSVKLVYAMTRELKIKDANGNEKKITALELRPSCRGELSFARQCGRILDHENPKIEFDPQTERVKSVSIRLQMATGRWETFTYSAYDFERWRKYSHNDRGRWKNDLDPNDPNFKYANKLYTAWRGGIDPEFAKAKCILRSLDKLGTNPNELAPAKVKFDPKNIIVDVDHKMEEAAASEMPTTEEAQYAEVISSTPHAESAPVSSMPNADQL